MANGEVGGKEFTVKGGVLLLGENKFFGEKNQGVSSLRMLKNSACLVIATVMVVLGLGN
jgi:hypothetical protein